MGYIYAWVKNLVCFYLLLTAAMHVLPQKGYRKYVRFFAGMLLTILVVSPALALLGNEELLKQKISQAEFFQDMDNMKLDTERLESSQKEIYLQEYEHALEMDVSRMAEEKSLAVHRADVCLTQEYEIASVEMEVSLGEDDGIFVQKAPYADGNSEYPKVHELKKDLMEYYRLAESQIRIVIM